MTTTTTTGHAGQVTGHWVTIDQAAALLGVSERTVRRRVARGEIRAGNAEADGRRVVLVERADRTGPDDDRTRRTPDDQADGDGGGWTEGVHDDRTVTGAALAVMADRSVNLAERRADELSADLVRVRRLAATGWAAAAVVGVLAAVGAVWGVRSIEVVRGRAAAADAAAGVLAGVVDAERERADTVTGRLAELTDELVTAAATAEAERVRGGLLADELADARARAERAEADRLAVFPPMLDAADGLP